MAKLSLPDIQALIAVGGYGGRGFLSPSSAAFGLSAAVLLDDLNLWSGAGYDLTDDEIDEIAAMIAQFEDELMEAGDVYPTDRCEIKHSVAVDIPDSTVIRLPFDTNIYDPEDMHDEVVNNSFIYAVSDGLHLVNVTVTWTANGTGIRSVRLWKYDSVLVTSIRWGVVTSGAVSVILSPSHSVVAQIPMVVGDFLYVQIYQTSGVQLQSVALASVPQFEVVKL